MIPKENGPRHLVFYFDPAVENGRCVPNAYVSWFERSLDGEREHLKRYHPDCMLIGRAPFYGEAPSSREEILPLYHSLMPQSKRDEAARKYHIHKAALPIIRKQIEAERNREQWRKFVNNMGELIATAIGFALVLLVFAFIGDPQAVLQLLFGP